MDGIFINGARPASKKAVREAVAAYNQGEPVRFEVEVTSMFNAGPSRLTLDDIGPGKVITFVGPDPYNARNFYGNIERKRTGALVVR